MTPIFPKSKIIQKPQFPSTLLANFWYLIIVKLVSDGKWQYLGLAPLLQTFRISEQSVGQKDLFDAVWRERRFSKQMVGIFN